MAHLNHQILESELEVFYSKQLQSYDRLSALANKLDADLTNVEMQPILDEMQSIMFEIDKSNVEFCDQRTQWDALENKPGPKLAKILKQVETHIHGILEIVNLAEKTAHIAKANMQPLFHSETRRIRMKNAYTDH